MVTQAKILHGYTYWWLVRVALVVDWRFLPQNFGQVVGTYEGILPFCECTWGGGSICRWWGHLNTKCHNWIFWMHLLHREVVGSEKLVQIAWAQGLMPQGDWSYSEVMLHNAKAMDRLGARGLAPNEPPRETFIAWLQKVFPFYTQHPRIMSKNSLRYSTMMKLLTLPSSSDKTWIYIVTATIVGMANLLLK